VRKIFIILLLVSFSAWSKVSLELKLDSNSIKQGQIGTGSLVVQSTDGNAGLSGLKGKTLGKSLYLFNVSPFMGKQGQLASDVKVIFTQVPASNSVTETINNEEISISWSNIQVVPTESSKSFLFGDFEIPSRLVIFPWIAGIIGLGFLALIVIRIRSMLNLKKSTKNRKLKLKDEITNSSNYDDVVLMWRQKSRYLNEFPQLENHFKTLEVVLFKYQFKPQRTEQEVNAVMDAYQTFKSSVLGDLNGI
jgi:hypothetical protein